MPPLCLEISGNGSDFPLDPTSKSLLLVAAGTGRSNLCKSVFPGTQLSGVGKYCLEMINHN